MSPKFTATLTSYAACLIHPIRRHQPLPRSMRVCPKPEDLKPKDMLSLWFVTSYVLYTTAAHLLSKAAVKLPLSPESAPVQLADSLFTINSENCKSVIV